MEPAETELTWVREVLSRQFDVPPEKVCAETRIREDLRFESLDLVDLVLEIEKRVGRRVEGEDISNVRTIGDVLRLMERLRGHPVG